jgi:hypothetical protein
MALRSSLVGERFLSRSLQLIEIRGLVDVVAVVLRWGAVRFSDRLRRVLNDGSGAVIGRNVDVKS